MKVKLNRLRELVEFGFYATPNGNYKYEVNDNEEDILFVDRVYGDLYFFNSDDARIPEVIFLIAMCGLLEFDDEEIDFCFQDIYKGVS